MKDNMKKVFKAGVALSMALSVTPTSLYAEELQQPTEGVTETTPETEVETPVGEETPSVEEGKELDTPEVPVEGQEKPGSSADQEGMPEAGEVPVEEETAEKEEVKTASEEVQVDTVFKGEGTQENPYQIGDADDLKIFAQKVNEGDAAYNKASYKLTSNIDLANQEWTPIGTFENKFFGIFDGANFTISNLTINNSELENAGLFGYIASPAKLTGITVNNANITAKSNVGVIAGGAFTGAAENCNVIGTINVTGNYKIGGMFGGGYIKLSNCHVNASGSVTGVYLATDLEGDNVGGLIGFRGEGDSITTENCSVSGIKIAGSRKVGGLIGSAFSDNIYSGVSVSNVQLECNAPYDYANGVAKNQLCVGGIIGIFMKGGSVGTLADVSVSDVSFSVTDSQVAQEDLPILGLVSGGYRASSFSGASAPDGKINLVNITVSGNNSGMNANKKFPGSLAMNGDAKVFELGTGTETDPYIISSVEDLKLLADTVSKSGLTYEGQFVKVKEDLTFDLSEGTQIGSSSKKFKGTFDGNGVVINNLSKSLFNGIEGATVKNIVVNGQTSSLFNNVYDSTIQNIKLYDVNINSTANIGALVTKLNGSSTVDGIEATGSIQGEGKFSNISLGGIIGQVATGSDDVTTIRNCINRANVSGGNKTHVGGIYGSGYGNSFKGSVKVENCKNYGNISSMSYWAGGITSSSRATSFISCINEGKVEGANIAGGIVGTAEANTSVTDSKNTGEIVANDGGDTERQSAGGIIGRSASGGNKVSKSTNAGNITAKHMAGGIIGGTWASGDPIDNCYNSGTIIATGTAEGNVEIYAGGIFGYNNIGNLDVKACLNEGVVKAENGSAYQIGRSFYYNVPGQGNQIQDCYYIDENGKIYLSSDTGSSDSSTSQDITYEELSNKLNTAGGVEDYWQIVGETISPNPDIPADFSALESTIAKADKLDASLFTQESYKIFEEVLNNAKNVFANPDATQEEVNKAVDTLTSAISSLVYLPADTTSLDKAIKAADEVIKNKDKYIDISSVETTLKEAKDYLDTYKDDLNITHNEKLNTLANKINDAIGGLILKADKTELNKLVENAKLIDREIYTEESLKVLDEAIKASEAILADNNATEEQVTQAAEKLNEALKGLTKKPENPTEKYAYLVVRYEIVGFGATGGEVVDEEKFTSLTSGLPGEKYTFKEGESYKVNVPKGYKIVSTSKEIKYPEIEVEYGKEESIVFYIAVDQTQKPETGEEQKPDNGKDEGNKENTDKEDGTNTGVTLGTGLFAGLATTAVSGLGILEVLKRKKCK